MTGFLSGRYRVPLGAIQYRWRHNNLEDGPNWLRLISNPEVSSPFLSVVCNPAQHRCGVSLQGWYSTPHMYIPPTVLTTPNQHSHVGIYINKNNFRIYKKCVGLQFRTFLCILRSQ